MRPMWKNGVTYSTTPVAVLKRWCRVLHQQLCYSLGESNKKLQELFGKLAAMKGAQEKFGEVPEGHAGGVVAIDAGEAKGKRARGASKKRSAVSNT